MAFNPLHDNLGNPHIKFRPKETFEGPEVVARLNGYERTEAVTHLYKHMIEISDDPSGSDPTPYLSEEDLATLANFKGLVDYLGWPEASLIEMRKGRRVVAPVWTALAGLQGVLKKGLHKATSHAKNYNFSEYKPERRIRGGIENVPVWVSPRTTATRGMTKVLFFPKTPEQHRGYIFGKLGLAEPTQLVAFCDDGKLRSLRGRELERSYGYGWGRLPDPELIKPALAGGSTYGVDHKNYASKTLREILLTHIPPIKLRGVNLSDFGLAT